MTPAVHVEAEAFACGNSSLQSNTLSVAHVAGDPGLEACQRCGTILTLFVERFDDDSDPLVLAQDPARR
jgi:xanthine/CO dehydrogenase XdhC/CoxF family maturation factor